MNSSRRTFIKTALLSLAALPVLGKLSGLSAFAAEELKMASEKEEPGKSLKYTPNADKPVPASAARKAKDKKNQYCYNCQLFTRIEGEKKKGTGKCMIMPKNKVNGGSWCMSWVQNPTVKD